MRVVVSYIFVVNFLNAAFEAPPTDPGRMRHISMAVVPGPHVICVVAADRVFREDYSNAV